MRDRRLSTAAVTLAGKNLRNTEVGDHYHSKDHAAAESQYVFIDANDLAARFAAGNEQFVIAELGFGTGLNLALSYQSWQQHKVTGTRLHYFAWEHQPLGNNLIKEFLAQHVETKLATKIVDKLPLRWPGWHSFNLANDVFVTLIYDDVASITEARLQADVWFVDGFAPKRNPAMWTPEIFTEVFRLTKPGGTLSTFSAASKVRQALTTAGFSVTSKAGFATKREMTVATKVGQFYQKSRPREIAVIGGGVAATAIKYVLGQRGIKPTMLAPSKPATTPASTNPSVLLTPRPTVKQTALGEVVTTCFAYAHNFFAQANLGKETGALLLAHNQRELVRQEKLAKQQWPADLLQIISAEVASELAGIKLTSPAMYFPLARHADGRDIVAYLNKTPSQDIDAEVTGLRPRGNKWLLEFNGQQQEFATVILACGISIAKLSPDQLTLKSFMGTLQGIPATQLSKKLQLPLLFGGCLTPAHNNQHYLIATKSFPEYLAELIKPAISTSSWHSVRAKTPDHLPLAGMLGEGLGVLGGLGSRGFVQALLLAQLVVAQLLDEPLPLPNKIIKAVTPGAERKLW